ncbi:MAG: ATP synthase subunit c [Candidatus Heimdallarchaeota archaeon LC_3]|nr:MAG: ATP synthase subunit c [Candidatus Heimdallarchaeota archaeon LC_3]
MVKFLDSKTKKMLKIQFIVVIGATILGILTYQLGNAVGNAVSSTASVSAITNEGMGFVAIGAGLAIGLAGLGAGIGAGTASAAAIAAITEKPETFGRSIIFVAFIEGIAIFGFVIAFQLFGLIA